MIFKYVKLLMVLAGTLWIAALIVLAVQLLSPSRVLALSFGGLAVGASAFSIATVLLLLKRARGFYERGSATLKGAERQLRILRNRTVKSDERIAKLDAALVSAVKGANQRLQALQNNAGAVHPEAISGGAYATERSILRAAIVQKLDISELFTSEQARRLLAATIDRGHFVEALALVRSSLQLWEGLTLTQTRKLFKEFRQLGYLRDALSALERVAEISGKPRDETRLKIFASELALFEGEIELDVELPSYIPADSPTRKTVHVVGKALPETQSGYTLRTQYTAEAQKHMGITPIVVAQSGASDREHDFDETYVHNGVKYYLLGGPQRNSTTWDQWLSENVRRLAQVVAAEKPEVIHAHADFLNAKIAEYVGDIYDIPVVYEARGFWEESWLSRQESDALGMNTATLWAAFGQPDAYELRKQQEAECRSAADAVVTLADVMVDHIEELAETRGLPVKNLSVVPNAVESRNFPVVPRNLEVLEEIGLDNDTPVLGYISSIVEYEGIDVLVDAHAVIVRAYNLLEEFELRRFESISAEEGEQDVTAKTLAELDEERPSGEGQPAILTELRSTLAEEASLHQHVSPELEHDEASDKLAWTQACKLLARDLSNLGAGSTKEGERLAMEILRYLADARFEHCPHLLIVGDGAELASLKKQVETLGTGSAVTFTGRIPHEQVLDYYSVIDLFIVPRRPSDVTHLVTPLKPFEAMSTGRPCLFSNVKALSEIATKSGAAGSFEAGDPIDLARTISSMLRDPSELARLATTGAEWVRRQRSWELNAARYFQVYEQVGAFTDPTTITKESVHLLENGISPRTMLETLAVQPLPSPRGWFIIGVKNYTPESIMEEGWRFAKFPATRFEPGLDWGYAGRTDRSWGFHLNAWEFMDPILAEYHASKDLGLLQWAIEVALDWWAWVKNSAPAELEKGMIWYDMSLSLRMARLARLLVFTVKSPLREQGIHLLSPVLAHFEEAMKPEAFNQNNNHGFFCAAASIDFPKILPGFPLSEDLHQLGVERMSIMAERQFGADGGHLEHSPDYHRMLLASFESAVVSELIEDEATHERVERASHVMGWLVQPDGTIVQFGDSPAFDVEEAEMRSLDERANFILTDGKEGVPDTKEMIVLPDTGYAIVRSPQPQARGERINSSYLALNAGFHSRAHKHADDLTFVWFDRGCELIVDAGRYGYVDLLPPDAPERLKGFYYSAPERQYVESTPAHNTLMIDGEDIERRNRAPYGSALSDCNVKSGIFNLRASVDFADYTHHRTLEFKPGKSLDVIDTVSVDGREEREAITWFNLDGSLDVIRSGNQLRVILPNSQGEMLVGTSGEIVELVKGQEDPLLGWRSRKDRVLEPAWNFGVRYKVNGQATLTTTFTFLHDGNSGD